MRLTDRRIKLHPLPKTGRIELHDSVVGGLYLRLTASGAGSWGVRRRIRGGPLVRLTLGPYPALSIEAARKLGRSEINDLASGIDTRAIRKAAAATSLTVRQVLEEYLTLHVRRHKAAYQADCRRMLDAELRPLADRAVRDLSSEAVVAWHAKFVSRARADKAARVLKAVLRFASDRHDLRSAEGKVATDALRTLRLWSKPKRKKTIVRDMLAWQKAVAALPNEAVREYLTTSALTGLRRSEWREARWHQLNLPRGVLRLPDPKNREEIEIPLSSQVIEILERRHRWAKGLAKEPPRDAAIFSADGIRPLGTKTIHQAVASTWKKIGRWQLHDLRRGFSTRADMLVPPIVARRVMGHATTDANAHDGYFSADATTLQQFVQRIANTIFKAPAEVVELASFSSAAHGGSI